MKIGYPSGGSGGSITVDSTPTNGSNNAVSSNGVFHALAGKEPADATILKETDIGVSIQAYNANATIQGNTFNGNSQLVKTTSDGRLPIINGINVKYVNFVLYRYISVDAASIYIDSLNIVADGGVYEIDVIATNSTATASYLSIFVNSDTTQANHRSAVAQFSTSTSYSQTSAAYFGYLYASSISEYSIKLSLSSNGTLTWLSHGSDRVSATNSAVCRVGAGNKINSESNVTSITLYAGGTAQFAAGTRVIIRKLGV